jgi:hypothetical protein
MWCAWHSPVTISCKHIARHATNTALHLGCILSVREFFTCTPQLLLTTVSATAPHATTAPKVCACVSQPVRHECAVYGSQITQLHSHDSPARPSSTKQQQHSCINHATAAPHNSLDGCKVLLAALGVGLHGLVSGLPAGRAHLQHVTAHGSNTEWACEKGVTHSRPPGLLLLLLQVLHFCHPAVHIAEDTLQEHLGSKEHTGGT